MTTVETADTLCMKPMNTLKPASKRQVLESQERGVQELESLLDAIHGTDRPATLPGHPGNGTYKEGK